MHHPTISFFLMLMAISAISFKPEYNITAQAEPSQRTNSQIRLEHLKDSITTAMDDQDYVRLNQAYESIIEYYASKGNYRLATIYQDKLVRLHDSIDLKNKENAMDDLRAKFESGQSEDELALINTRNALQQSLLERQKLQRYIYLGGGIAIAIIVLGLLSRLRYLRRTSSVLEERNRKIEIEKHKAEEAEHVREKFLAKMSHEIRTPMNAIMGLTNILRKNPHDPGQEKYFNAIWQSSENLLFILNDILDLSKLEAGKIEIEKLPFNPMDELMKLREIMKYKAEEKGIQIKCELDENIPPVLIGDPIRLNQIMINLTGNAIKFTEKGQIFVSIKLRERNNDQAVLEFEISDTGIGIPADRLEKIFESFTQAESDTTRRYGGTGLGLTISKELVELQNGNIKVKSELGKGSVFSFEIPYQIGEAKIQVPQAEITPEFQLKNLNILLVEDNQFNVMVAIDELNSIIENASIDLAENGIEAVDKVKSNTYDIVLMDIQMELMNGYEAAEAIRAMDAPKKDIPIIAITANAMKDELKKCLEAGMNDFISKPFNPEELKLKIKQLV